MASSGWPQAVHAAEFDPVAAGTLPVSPLTPSTADHTRPACLCCCSRHRLYPQYKAHRHEHPAALTDAICQVLALADALGIPVLAVPGVEADDVVGTLAAQAEQDGFGSVVIMSRDKVGRQQGLVWASGVCVCSKGAGCRVQGRLLRRCGLRAGVSAPDSSSMCRL